MPASRRTSPPRARYNKTSPTPSTKAKKSTRKTTPARTKNIRVENSGDIRITLQNAERYNGATLTLHYDRANKQWQCQTIIPPRLLPLNCR